MQNAWNILPKQFLETLDRFVDQKKKEEILESFTYTKPSTFRANTLKISADDLETELQKLSIETERVPWYKNAFMLKNVPQKILTETDLYKNGFLYVQSLSSMIPPLVLDPKENEKILDLTAAPGSKTTQMAMMMGGTGEILANDKSRIRMYKLEANLKMQGVINVKTSTLPGEMIWKKYPEYFDKTLVDVPCSMEGRFNTQDPKTFQDWTPGKVKMLSGMQKWLLRSAFSATKVGGSVVYSTCTLNPVENEEVIDWILKKEKGKVIIEEFSIDKLHFSSGVTQVGNKIFDNSVKYTARIFPSTTMEGFFIAKLRKIASNIDEQMISTKQAL